MKKIMMILLLMAMVAGASAMPGGHMGGGFVRGPRTTVIVGGGFYSPFYAPFGFYGYPFYAYPSMPYRPTKLDLQIEDIKNDYSDKIASVKLDSDLTGKERREKIRELKKERNDAILDARKNYYKS